MMITCSNKLKSVSLDNNSGCNNSLVDRISFAIITLLETGKVHALHAYRLRVEPEKYTMV